MLFHPRIDGGIAFDSTVESQQFRSHRRFIFAFGSMLAWHLNMGIKMDWSSQMGQSSVAQDCEARLIF
jgi:hypothetical protein